MPCLVRISEAVSLAIHSMALLARNPEKRISIQEMARTLHVSSHHLAKVMQKMVKTGLARSVRGPQGGFSLEVPASDIQLLMIYENMEGPISHEGCLLHKPVCDGNNCMLGALVYSLHEKIRECLATTSLADFSVNAIPSRDMKTDGS
jgi:Rrf2 family protein